MPELPELAMPTAISRMATAATAATPRVTGSTVGLLPST